MKPLRIIVELDLVLADGMHIELASKLARGIHVTSCERGVCVDGLPGHGRHAAPTFASSSAAVMCMHNLADIEAEFAVHHGGDETATGRYMLDRSAFLRLAAGELVRRRRTLWLAETLDAAPVTP
jgi:hypothetical protein